MDIFHLTFQVILYQPLFNVLILFYYFFRDFGFSIIGLTIFIRLLLHPLSLRSLRSQRALLALQPKIQEIQKKYAGDKTKENLAILELYRKEKINPLSGLFLLLIQLPILIALYQVFLKGFQLQSMDFLYSFLPRPEKIEPLFLGFLNLTQPSWVIAVLAGFFQFFQSKTNLPKNNKENKDQQELEFSKIFQKQMTYFFPFLTFFILLALPSAIGLYIIVTTLFSILEFYLVKR